MGLKKPAWLTKFGLKPSKGSAAHHAPPSLDLVRVFSRGFSTNSKFKTVILDDAMTVSDLIGAALKRFKLGSGAPRERLLYSLSILRGNGMPFSPP